MSAMIVGDVGNGVGGCVQVGVGKVGDGVGVTASAGCVVDIGGVVEAVKCKVSARCESSDLV